MDSVRRDAKWVLPVVLGCVVLAGCSPLSLLNTVSGTRHIEASFSTAYGPDERQTLDVYRPAESLPSSPVVVFFYGGGWREGSKENYRFVAAALTAAGFAVVIPDYRVYPDVRFPAFVEDAAAAVAWTFGNAGRLGAEPGSTFLMGHSAGAHIAALLALDERYLKPRGIEPSRLAGLVGVAGPYDFLPIRSGYLTEVFPEDVRARSQPVRFVSPDAPPTLLIHGRDDGKVRPENSRSLADALEEAGVPVRLRLYDGVGHARIVAALAPPLGFLADTLDDSLAFMRDVLESAPPATSAEASAAGGPATDPSAP